MDLKVQVRREDGAILFARSVTDAMQMAQEDQTIWKISWTDIDERIRLVRRDSVWVFEPIPIGVT